MPNLKLLKCLAVTLVLVIFSCPAYADSIWTAGNQLLRNGVPFKMHAVEITAYEAPTDWYGPSEGNSSTLMAAYDHFNATELQYALAYGANTIDFQVSQMGLDPLNTAPSTTQRVAYSPTYVAQLQSAVELARSMGFIVMVSVADTPFSGDKNELGLPTAGTLRANLTLANLFKDDLGIILELMIEPYPVVDTTVLATKAQSNADYIYINGGTDNRGNVYVGANSIIQQIRATGARNLIISQIPSQYFASYQDTDGSYPWGQITDTIDAKLAFGVHSYFQFKYVGTTPAQWDLSFGNFAAGHPLIVSEWDQTTTLNANTAKPLWCGPLPDGLGAPLNTPLQFLHYINTHAVNGVNGWAFDMPQSLISEYGAGTPTTMAGAVCGQPGGGIGLWIEDEFEGDLPGM